MASNTTKVIKTYDANSNDYSKGSLFLFLGLASYTIYITTKTLYKSIIKNQKNG